MFRGPGSVAVRPFFVLDEMSASSVRMIMAAFRRLDR
jgi:hypothetical protein